MAAGLLPPPAGLWSGLDAALPVALLPVRLETRFGTRPATADDGTAVAVPVLKVRIYPDEVSVTPTTSGLGAVERSAGADFWTAQTAPATTEEAALPGAVDRRRRAAWEVLVRRVSAARAVFVADATAPGAPGVPDRVEQAPAARLLPDSWVISGYVGDTPVFTELLIRPAGDLQVGPTRGTGSEAFDPTDPHLVRPGDGLRWTTEFAAAVAAGMAAVIDLATPEQVRDGTVPAAATSGLDTLVVVGVREPGPDRTAAAEAGLLADLLTAHAAADRLALPAPGTPTNTVGDRPSGWSSAPDVFAGYDRVLATAAAVGGAPPAPSTAGTDAADLESALGLPAGLLAGLDGADRTEGQWAAAMARALFPVTLGEVLGTLSHPAVYGGPDEDYQGFLDRLDVLLPFTGDHLAAHVRPGGPLPALRVGRQPYGVLPVMAPTGWARRPDEPEPLAALVDTLRVLRLFWEQAARAVPVLSGSRDPSTDLVRVLGLAPVPHPGAYQVRTATGIIGAIFSQLAGVVRNPVPPGNPVETAEYLAGSTDLAVRLEVAGYRYLLGLTLPGLVDGTLLQHLTLGGVKAMRAAVAITDPARTGWESPAGYLSRLADELEIFRLVAPGPGETRPTDLLFLLAEHALALAGELDSVRLLGRMQAEWAAEVLGVSPEIAVSGLSAARTVTEVQQIPLGQLGPPVQLPDDVRQAAIPAVIADDGLRASALAALGLPPTHLAGFPGTRAAIRALGAAGLDDETYTRLTSQALAACATRLDAWITSVASRRLAGLRADTPAGTQLGSWGVLLDVRPTATVAATEPPDWPTTAGAGVTDGPLRSPGVQVGYLHAPSLGQARTAGVLRAAELAHSGDGSTLASIDLTSARVRVARTILESVALGQPLGALLGYRLERSLGEAGLHEEVSRLRAAYPQRRAAGAPGTPAAGSDAVVPAEVVDGLEVWQNSAAATAVAAPADPAAFAAALAALGDGIDAVADLLVAEGVHQLTSGRPESAGASFTAVAEGTEPPEPVVAREPRSGVSITHLLVAVPDPAAGAAGWNRTAPRALLAPTAELWAETVLGDAGPPVTGLGLCALDVVAEAAGGIAHRPLDDRLAAAGVEPAGTAYELLLALAGTAADILAGARPAVAADLGVPADPADTPTAAPGTGTATGTVHALAPPSAADLAPLLAAVGTVLDGLDAAVAAVAAAAGDPLTGAAGPPPEVDAGLLAPFARLGLPGSVRAPSPTVPAAVAQGAASAAAAVLRDCDGLLPAGPTRADRLAAVPGAADPLDTLVRLTRRLGGPPVVPAVAVASSVGAALVAGAGADVLEDWLTAMGRVRPALSTYDDLRLFAAAAGVEPAALQAAQLPFVAAEGWLGGPLPTAAAAGTETSPNTLRAWTRPDGPRSHLVLAGPAAAVAAPTVAALVLDEVVQVLPAPTSITGLAVNYDAPDARPPQSLLLAVLPDPALSWTWQQLDACVREAVALARLRGVELDDLSTTGVDEYLPLTYVRDGLPGTSPLSELTDTKGWLLSAFSANRLVQLVRP